MCFLKKSHRHVSAVDRSKDARGPQLTGFGKKPLS
jgi:hypothetical protein